MTAGKIIEIIPVKPVPTPEELAVTEARQDMAVSEYVVIAKTQLKNIIAVNTKNIADWQDSIKQLGVQIAQATVIKEKAELTLAALEKQFTAT